MSAQSVPLQLRSGINLALARLRQARQSGDVDLEWVAESWLDRLLDQVPRKGEDANAGGGDCPSAVGLSARGTAG